MNRLVSITPLFMLALGGCSSQVDHASAVKVMGSAMSATVAADGHVMSANWKPFAGQVSVTLNNPVGGGTAQILGTANDSNGVVSTTLDIAFNHWHDALENITLDGSLHEAGSFTSGVPLAGSVELNGALAVSGAVNGAVDFDVKGSYSPTGFSVSGQVGGQSLNGAFSVSAH
jgi:hypothetical protein